FNHIDRLAVERPDHLDHLDQAPLRLIPGHQEFDPLPDEDIGPEVVQVALDLGAVGGVDRKRPADEIERGTGRVMAHGQPRRITSELGPAVAPPLAPPSEGGERARPSFPPLPKGGPGGVYSHWAWAYSIQL